MAEQIAPHRQLVKELGALLGGQPIATDMSRAPSLVRLLSDHHGLSQPVAAQVAWLVLLDVVEGADSQQPPYPLKAARHLLGLVEYPQDAKAVITDLTQSAADLNSLHRDIQFIPLDKTKAGQRRLIAALAGGYGGTRTALIPRHADRARSKGPLDKGPLDGIAEFILKRFRDALADRKLIVRLNEEVQSRDLPLPVSRTSNGPRLKNLTIGVSSLRRGAAWQQLARLSRLLARELDTGARRDHEMIGLSDGVYIRRAVEDKVITTLLDQGPRAGIIISAEAGYGKSTLLWSIFRTLQARDDIEPLLISAAWFTSANMSNVLESSTVLEAVSEISNEGLRPILLLDTADLILHDESSRMRTLELLEELTDREVAWAATTRPYEATALKPLGAKGITLNAYDDYELRQAVLALAKILCPYAATPVLQDRFARTVARGLPATDAMPKLASAATTTRFQFGLARLAGRRLRLRPHRVAALTVR
jgi:hypothetical protein